MWQPFSPDKHPYQQNLWHETQGLNCPRQTRHSNQTQIKEALIILIDMKLQGIQGLENLITSKAWEFSKNQGLQKDYEIGIIEEQVIKEPQVLTLDNLGCTLTAFSRLMMKITTLGE